MRLHCLVFVHTKLRNADVCIASKCVCFLVNEMDEEEG